MADSPELVSNDLRALLREFRTALESVPAGDNGNWSKAAREAYHRKVIERVAGVPFPFCYGVKNATHHDILAFYQAETKRRGITYEMLAPSLPGALSCMRIGHVDVYFY